MPNTLNPRLGVSTWSLNKSITAGTPLLDIPAQVAAHGLGKLEVCHFHLPGTDDAYLEKFRVALGSAGVEFYTLLIDEGDITHPNPTERKKALAMITDWIEVAAECGAKRVRVIGGYAEPSESALHLSEAGFRNILAHADDHGIRVVTENWHRLLDQPAAVQTLLGRLDGQVGLKLDFGNWPAPLKYEDLPKIADLAECTHAKAHFTAPGQMDQDDFTRCLDICADANFDGPHILIFSDPGDEWQSLDQMRDVAASYVAAGL
ncbi:MAG: sugar phosphate isomerase/epimerase family protein [Janthinobacterium lividum]